MADSSVTSLQNLIDGELSTPQDADRLTVLNPATREPLAEMPLSIDDDVDRAVRSARRGFEVWSKTTPSERAIAMSRIAASVEEHAEELARLEALDAGKPYSNALGDELPIIVDSLRFFGGACRVMSGQAAGEYVEGHTSMIRREPIGVVAAITPWNYPLWQAVWKVGP